MNRVFAYTAETEADMLVLGDCLAGRMSLGLVVHLCGDLGVGKTALCRGILRAKGYAGNVKSPTYTLVEPYELEDMTLYHFDLYRLGDPEEIEYTGMRDYLNTTSICLIEWSEKAHGFLPEPDLEIVIQQQGMARYVECHGKSETGCSIINGL